VSGADIPGADRIDPREVAVVVPSQKELGKIGRVVPKVPRRLGSTLIVVREPSGHRPAHSGPPSRRPRAPPRRASSVPGRAPLAGSCAGRPSRPASDTVPAATDHGERSARVTLLDCTRHRGAARD